MTGAKKLYLLLWIACVAGYGWLYYSFNHQAEPVGVCLFKQVTHIPCPSCGTTRAVLMFTEGHPAETFFVNPIGYLIVAVLLIVPVWLVSDWFRRKQTLYSFYRRFENTIKRPYYAVPLILLILANWAWTISKSL
jgi:hypothetical protein